MWRAFHTLGIFNNGFIKGMGIENTFVIYSIVEDSLDASAKFFLSSVCVCVCIMPTATCVDDYATAVTADDVKSSYNITFSATWFSHSTIECVKLIVCGDPIPFVWRLRNNYILCMYDTGFSHATKYVCAYVLHDSKDMADNCNLIIIIKEVNSLHISLIHVQIIIFSFSLVFEISRNVLDLSFQHISIIILHLGSSTYNLF